MVVTFSPIINERARAELLYRSQPAEFFRLAEYVEQRMLLYRAIDVVADVNIRWGLVLRRNQLVNVAPIAPAELLV